MAKVRSVNQSGIRDSLYFPSKKDWWLVLLIWMAVTLSVVGGILPLFLEEVSIGYGGMVVSLCVGMDALMLWLLYGTGYRCTANCLDIYCGPFRFRVFLKDIRAIFPASNLLSSPACSFDRLKINYGNPQRSIMISPADKAGFLSAILSRCPTLIDDGGNALRQSLLSPE